jgi:hydrogenase maturation protease
MARSEPSDPPESTSIARSDGEAPAVAIVAVGNPIMGDDGIGARVIETLEPELSDREYVTLANAGTTAFFALEAMSGCDWAIVLDAIATGADPGPSTSTATRMEPSRAPSPR